MRIRVGILAVFAAVSLLILASCGGGGGAILDIVHEGKFNSAGAYKPAEIANSEFYRELKKKIDSVKRQIDMVEDKYDKMDIKLEQLGHITNIGNVEHIVGPFNAESLKEYYEEEKNWDIDEETEEGQTYYLNKDNDANAFMMVAGGVLFADKDTIEDIIGAMTKGKDKLADDKSFANCRQLIDPSATMWNLVWDELDGVRNQWKALTRIEKDKDFEEALEAIDGYGVSYYWSGDFRVVHKLLFSKDDKAEEVEKMLKDNVKKILEDNYMLIMPFFFNEARDRGEIKDLEDKVNVARSGAIVEISVGFTWDDVEKIFKRN